MCEILWCGCMKWYYHMIQYGGEDDVIRRRDTYEDLLSPNKHALVDMSQNGRRVELRRPRILKSQPTSTFTEQSHHAEHFCEFCTCAAPSRLAPVGVNPPACVSRVCACVCA